MPRFELVRRLMLREEWRFGPGALRDTTPLAGGLPAGDAVLVRAAAAVGAGEPKRAERILDAAPADPADVDAVAVERAIRIAAGALEHNWFPGGGGAVLERGAVHGLGLEPLAPQGSEALAVVLLANRLLTAAPTWRSIAAGLRRGLSVAGAEDVIPAADQLARQLFEGGLPALAAPAFLVAADVLVRSGRHTRAPEPLAAALRTYRTLGDPVGVASCELARGDWSADPLGHPELLGEDLEGTGTDRPVVVEADAQLAAERYAEAERLFTSAGASRGLAAVALRRARLAVAAGDPATAEAELERCRVLAGQAGDGALTQLAAVHRALLGLGPPATVGAAVGGWASTVGSRSYARGLARLCFVRARRVRAGGDVVRARHAVLVAEAINDAIGAETEPLLVRREMAAQYGAANYRRAALVLSLLDLVESEESFTRDPDVPGWIALVDIGMGVQLDADALRDAEAMARNAVHLRRIADLDPGGQTAAARRHLTESVGQADVLVPLYRGVAARAHGDIDEAQVLFDDALRVATAMGPDAGLLPAVVLGTARRTAEAVAFLEPLVRGGVLGPEFAGTFYTRLGRYDLALPAIEELELLGAPPPDEPAWQRPALHAEALVGAGRPAEGLPLVEAAIGQFEEHLAGLSRDVLRTMASDDLTAAGMYTTAIRAHTALHVRGDGKRLARHMAAAFELSDRCRGMSLRDLIDLDQAAGADPVVVAAVRDWQRAGAELARTIEGVAASVATAADPAGTRRTVRDAERELDDREAALATVAPAVLEGRRRTPVPARLADVRARLDPGTLLIQYHAFDDELVGLAVTADAARMEHATHPTPALTAEVQRFVRSVADRRSTTAERARLGEPLTAALLTPFADELADHRRLVIVPYGPLSALPFHVLPGAAGDLATTHVVSYLPAASVLPERRGRVGGPGSDVLVVGDPDHAPRRSLRRLPGAGVEATAVGRLYGSPALVGAAARRDVVMERLRSADVVHLATHGLLVEGSPYCSELALTGDASLTVPDLMGLDTHIGLAVLSACDSGRGHATAAGDVIGLTRALLAAGADELVVSQWPVDDRVGCLLMVAFHEQLHRGSGPAEALAAASAAVRGMDREASDRAYAAMAASDLDRPAGARSARTLALDDDDDAAAGPGDLSHPYYWAPFVHIGR